MYLIREICNGYVRSTCGECKKKTLHVVTYKLTVEKQNGLERKLAVAEVEKVLGDQGL
jgi:hypothetical protein